MRKFLVTVFIVIGVFLTTKTYAAISPAVTFCINNGGTVSSINNSIGLCVFKDGTQCGDTAYANGTCKPGQYTDWAAAQPKDPDFTFLMHESGWVSDNHSVNFVDVKDAKYYYYNVAVQNINPFSSPSQPTTVTVYGDTTQTFNVPSLAAEQASPFFSIYIPITKVQKVDLAVNADKSVKETDYSNDTLYDRPATPNIPTLTAKSSTHTNSSPSTKASVETPSVQATVSVHHWYSGIISFLKNLF